MLGQLVGAAAVSFAVMLSIVLYTLLSQVRFHRRDMAVLHAMGFHARPTLGVVPWQSLPLAIVSTVVGLPVGIQLGEGSTPVSRGASA